MEESWGSGHCPKKSGSRTRRGPVRRTRSPAPLGRMLRIHLPGSRWAKRGTRLRAPHDQRAKWAYIFGALCPARARAPVWSCPDANPRHGRAPVADQRGSCVRRSPHPTAESGRIAYHFKARCSEQHYHRPFTATISEAEPRRKCLPIYSRQPALEPRVQELQQHRRPLLRELEKTRGTAMADHVNRMAQMGQWPHAILVHHHQL